MGQRVLTELGETENISERQLQVIEKFVCEMYGRRGISSIHEARLDIFLKKYKPSEKGTVISCVKEMDGS